MDPNDNDLDNDLTVSGVAWTIFFMLVGMTGEHIVHERLHWHWVPEGGTAILSGVALSFLDYMTGKNIKADMALSTPLFKFALLPFVIFGAGFELRKRGMFENFGTILTFAFLGTILSAVVVSTGVYMAFPDIDIYACLMFGSLISAVDPVATLAVMSGIFNVDKRVKPPMLYNIVLGESIINDAVAIVLFVTFENFYFHDDSEFAVDVIPEMIGRFLLIFVVSVAIGFGFGMASAWLFKCLRLDGYLRWEFTGVMFIAYLSYLTAELLGFSGLIAIFFCGITMSDYTWINFSEMGKITVYRCVHSVAYCAETMIFVYLGLAVFAFDHHYNPKLIGIALGLCLLGRTMSIFGFTPIVNLFRKTRKISCIEQIVLWFGGLRGAIAFALSVELLELTQEMDEVSNKKRGTETHHEMVTVAQEFVTTTLMIVIITTFFFGGMTPLLMKCLGIKPDPDIETFDENVKQVGGSCCGVLITLNDHIKTKLVRPGDESEMMFEGHLALRIDRLVPAKKATTLDPYFQAFFEKHTRDLPEEEYQLLQNVLNRLAKRKETELSLPQEPLTISPRHAKRRRERLGLRPRWGAHSAPTPHLPWLEDRWSGATIPDLDDLKDRWVALDHSKESGPATTDDLLDLPKWSNQGSGRGSNGRSSATEVSLFKNFVSSNSETEDARRNSARENRLRPGKIEIPKNSSAGLPPTPEESRLSCCPENSNQPPADKLPYSPMRARGISGGQTPVSQRTPDRLKPPARRPSRRGRGSPGDKRASQPLAAADGNAHTFANGYGSITPITPKPIERPDESRRN